MKTAFGKYKTFVKEFNDEAHFSNYYKSVSSKGHKIIGVADIGDQYFLFGGDACDILLMDGNIEAVIKAEQEDGIGWECFVWVDGVTTPVDLLYAFHGFGDYCVITEQEYLTLMRI